MNKEVWYGLMGLNPLGMETLLSGFANAPLMQTLIRAYRDYESMPPTTQKLVREIYGVGLSDPDYARYRNRFFKLRKKLLHRIEEIRMGAGTEFPVTTPLEKEFFRARNLMEENNYGAAKPVLETILSDAQKLGVYEWIPEIISMLSICAGVFQADQQERQDWVLKYEHSIRVLEDFHRMKLLNRQATLIPKGKGHRKAALRLLDKMRRIAKRHPGEARMKLAYHFCAANHSGTWTENGMRYTRRHLDAIEKMISESPALPALHYQPGYEFRLKYHWIQMKMIFHWQLGDYETAYQYLTRYWEAASGPYQRYLQLSENVYRNKANLEIRTGRFEAAESTIFSFLNFLKENDMQEKTPGAWNLLAFMYSRAAGALQPDNPDFLLRKTDEYIRGFPVESSSRLLLEAICIKTDFLMALGRYEDAWKNFQLPLSRQFFESLGIPLAEKFYKFPSLPMEKRSGEALSFLQEEIREALRNPANEEVEETLKWFLTICQDW